MSVKPVAEKARTTPGTTMATVNPMPSDIRVLILDLPKQRHARPAQPGSRRARRPSNWCRR